jgi:hypothetical protein
MYVGISSEWFGPAKRGCDLEMDQWEGRKRGLGQGGGLKYDFRKEVGMCIEQGFCLGVK